MADEHPDHRRMITELVIERLTQHQSKALSAEAYGPGFLSEAESTRIADAVLAELKAIAPGHWPESPKAKCTLDGSVLRTVLDVPPGPIADQLARAGLELRYADGSRYEPEGGFEITVRAVPKP